MTEPMTGTGHYSEAQRLLNALDKLASEDQMTELINTLNLGLSAVANALLASVALQVESTALISPKTFQVDVPAGLLFGRLEAWETTVNTPSTLSSTSPRSTEP